MNLNAWLADAASRRGIPGVVAGFDTGSGPVLAPWGELSRRTGVAVTDDTLFQIGSISKTYTATLVVQLAGEGLIDLDKPVRAYVPEAPDGITARHLLTHASGIDGDLFLDTGRGDDCVARYVATLNEVPRLFPPGKMFSYSNSGFVLLGRLVEAVRKTTWDAALGEGLLRPLGLKNTVTLPEEALLRRTAVGHIGAEREPAPVWDLPRAVGPAGTICADLPDLLAYARAHLDGAEAMLSPADTAAMRAHETDVPDPMHGDGFGLGWQLRTWGGRLVFGHDGGTIGQFAFLRCVTGPDGGLAIGMLTNGGAAAELFDDFLRLPDGEFDLGVPEPLRPPAEPVDIDPAPQLGIYERTGERIEIVLRDGAPAALRTPTGGMVRFGTVDPLAARRLAALDERTLINVEPEYGRYLSHLFLDPDPAGRPRILHVGGRVTPRRSS